MKRLLRSKVANGGRSPGGFALLVYAFALTAVWMLLLEKGSQGHFHHAGQHTFHHNHFFFGSHLHQDAESPGGDRPAPQEHRQESNGGAVLTFSLHLTFLVLQVASGPPIDLRAHADRVPCLPAPRVQVRRCSGPTSPRSPPPFLPA